MRLNKKCVRDDRPKPAQRRHKPELPDLLSQIEIEFDATEMLLSMKRRQVTFNRNFE